MSLRKCSFCVSNTHVQKSHLGNRSNLDFGAYVLRPQFVFVTQQQVKAVDPKKEVIGKRVPSAFIRILTLVSFLVPLHVCNWRLKAFICSLVETVRLPGDNEPG